MTRSMTGSMPSNTMSFLRRASGHISWNVWLDGAWRQMAIIQGEGLELSEAPREQWSGLTHPWPAPLPDVCLRHGEPLTDAIIGQGVMSVGGGGVRWGWAALSLRSPGALGSGVAADDNPHPGALPTVL